MIIKFETTDCRLRQCKRSGIRRGVSSVPAQTETLAIQNELIDY